MAASRSEEKLAGLREAAASITTGELLTVPADATRSDQVRKLVADGTSVHSVHTADQLGWDANGDRMIELERPDPGLRALYEAAMKSLGFTFPPG